MPEMLDPDFAPLLRAFELSELEAEPHAVWAMWGDFRLAYVNEAWVAFARSNGGEAVLTRWPLGSDVRAAFAGALKDRLSAAFAQVLARGEAFEHRYECSSAELHRDFNLRALSLRGQGVLVINRLVHEAPHDPARPRGDAELKTYQRADGFVVQCSYCRCLRRASGEREAWDWVPAFVESPPPLTSHGICPPCLSHAFPP